MDSVAFCSCGINEPIETEKKPLYCGVFSFSLPADGRVQAVGWPVLEGNFVLCGGLPPMRSDWWTLETVGDWGMLGRVRDLASLGLCSFLSSDLFGHNEEMNSMEDFSVCRLPLR